MRRNKDAGPWRIPRAMLMRTLIPGSVSALALGLSNIADALTVGIRIGETALAAIGIVTPIYLIFNILALSLGSGGGITHSRLTAEGKNGLALLHFRRAALWALGVGLFFSLLGGLFPGLVLRLLSAGEDYPELWALCLDYARPLLIASPVLILNVFLYYFVKNDDQPRLAALAFTVGGVLDLSLNLLLVLILNLGVRGAILSTIIAQAASLILLATHFFSRRGILHLRDILNAQPEDPRQVRACLAGSLRSGASSSLSIVFQFGSQLMINHLLMDAGRQGRIPGDLYVAVFDLVLNIAYVLQPIYMTVGESMQPCAATFSVEHDRESLRFIRRLGLRFGLGEGLLLAALIAAFAGPISRLFGLRLPEQMAVAVPAIRIYLLSTPFAGLLLLLVLYDQAVRHPWLAIQGTFLRDAVPQIPFALAAGLLWPESIWWAFLPAEALAAGIFLLLQRRVERQGRRQTLPVFRAALTNSSHELGDVVNQVAEFCEAQGIPPAKAVQLQLGVEELCAVTMQKAFSGQKDEYIQVTLVVEPGPRYVLHIRDSAPFFNPLDLKMEKARKDMESSIMDSIGVMMVRRQSRHMEYRNYQGFNTLTVIYE